MSRYAPVGRYAPVAERFWQKVDQAGPIPAVRPDLGSCWLWTAGRSDTGYGSFVDGGHRRNAHRWAWEAEHGPVPVGLELDHLCREPACVRPSHQEPVTHAENVRRGVSPVAKQAQQTECGRGHPLDGPGADVYLDRRGSRQCRACRRERRRSARKVAA